MRPTHSPSHRARRAVASGSPSRQRRCGQAAPRCAAGPSRASSTLTYSIIGHDPRSGEFGIAVQSRWFDAGQVAWIANGIGAVCTQAIAEPRYGSEGLELLRRGERPEDALGELKANDEGRELRQVAIADASGMFAQHTGAGCVAAAGHVLGRDCCAQGNMLASDGCWEAMVAAYESAPGEMPDRLLAALEAAERAGGDARGRQAARLLVRPADPAGAETDLRVIDHPQPVEEVKRLLELKRAYDHLDRALDLAADGELDAAAEEADMAASLAPGEDQVTFWRATVLAGADRLVEAQALLREAAANHPGWTEFLHRCIAAGLLPPETQTLAEASDPERRG